MITLLTTDSQLHALADAEDRTRDSSSTVKVDRQALRNLLRDHYTLYTAALGQKHRFAPGEDQRSLA